MGDGGVVQPVRAHDWQTRREIRGEHARKRSSRQGTHVTSHPGK